MMEIVIGAAAGLLAGFLASLPFVNRARADADDCAFRASSAENALAAAREQAKQAADHIERLKAQLLAATRYRGWKGVYTNAKGNEVPVVGLAGYRKGGQDYVIVEPYESPGQTPYPVKRNSVRWEG